MFLTEYMAGATLPQRSVRQVAQSSRFRMSTALCMSLLLVTGFGVQSALAQVTLTAPASGATDVALLPTFTWTDGGTGAVSYDLYIDTDSDFTGITPINVATTSHTLTTPLSLGMTYHWKVDAMDGTPAVLASSGTFTFVTAVLSLTNPTSGATDQALKPLLDWVDSGTGATHYDVTYDTQNDFLSGSAVTVSDLTVTEHQITTLLSTNTNYFWRVQGKDGAGGTVIATSSTLSFSTHSTDGTAGLPVHAIVQAGAFTSAHEAFVGTYGFGVYKWNPTTGWEQKNNGLTNHWVYGLVATASKIYVGTWGGGIFESSDGGDNWISSGLSSSYVRGLAKNSSDVVYATGDFSEVWRLNGASWDSVGVIQEFVVEPWGIAIDPVDDNHLYAATRYGLYESTDGGSTWTGALTGQQTFSVEVHPTTRDVYVGTTTGLSRRTHGSTSFDVLRTTATAAYSIAFDSSNRLFVGYWGPPGVEVSTDGGTSWTSLSLTPPGEMASKSSNSFRVVSVVPSPFDGSLIVGTEDGGTFVIPGNANSVDVEDAEVPQDFTLHQNYPNPFNPETLIGYALPDAQHVRIAVYDVLGREVEILHEGIQQAGRHEIVFRANDLPSGVYVYRLEAAGHVETRLMNLLK